MMMMMKVAALLPLASVGTTCSRVQAALAGRLVRLADGNPSSACTSASNAPTTWRLGRDDM